MDLGRSPCSVGRPRFGSRGGVISGEEKSAQLLERAGDLADHAFGVLGKEGLSR